MLFVQIHIVLFVFVASIAPSCSKVLCRVDTRSITVSGISSGAALAVQMEIAYSSFISGAAIVAGVPYYCARDSSVDATTECMLYPELIPVAKLEQDMKDFAQKGLIDEIGNLTNHALYLFSGILDTVVAQGSVRLIEQIARDLGVVNIATEYNIFAEHCLPTDSWGDLCSVLGIPFINNCEYDMAGRSLEHMYGKLNPPVTPIEGNIITLDQQKFIPGAADPSSISMDQKAYVYVPTGCQKSHTTCKLHVSFHGCAQGAEEVGEVYVLHAGWNKWAESNNIIVVYPQAIIHLLSPLNPQGCWDWWGYTTPDYANQKGLQMATIKNIIDSFL